MPSVAKGSRTWLMNHCNHERTGWIIHVLAGTDDASLSYTVRCAWCRAEVKWFSMTASDVDYLKDGVLRELRPYIFANLPEELR